jgi:peptide/nickel transport system permease protein
VIRYLFRRLLYLIPTVGGVILITFILFNMVGGSPAMVALGKNASPQALEEFDEERGFNRPLLVGWWTGSRAFPDVNFRTSPSLWRETAGATYVPSGNEPGFVRLAPGSDYHLPFAFPLRRETTFRLVVVGRWPSGARTDWQAGGLALPEPGHVKPGARWVRREWVFRTPATGDTDRLTLSVSAGAVDIRSVTLQRRMPHWYESQLFEYVRKVAKWDLGESVATHQKVSTMLRRGLAPSLMLTVPVFFGGLVVSVALALVCAYQRNRWLDRVLVIGAVVLMSVNYLVWIIFGQFFLAYKLHWFPIWGFESWRYLLLPIAIGLLSGLGGNLRFYRTVMLDELYKDYVRTAFAKGLSPAGVLFKHVLPNAMIPIITNTVIALPFLYTGSLLLESFFGIPGLGGLSVNAINSSDVDVVRGVVLVGAFLYVAAGLVSDVCYALADPRVKLK